MGLRLLAWPLRFVGIEDLGGFAGVLSRLPGVPIFFFVSGFLISRSFQVNSDVGWYARNRLLRIYPALWVCFGVSLLLVAASGYFGSAKFHFGTLVAWIVAQLTVIQFFNPDFMRDFGVGVLNGSLWTIAVEIQFYALTPALYVACRSMNVRYKRFLLVTLMLGLCTMNVAYNLWPAGGLAMVRKFVGITFLPWAYMFFAGVVVQWNFARLHKLLAGRFVWGVIIFVCCSVVAQDVVGFPSGNGIDPLQFAGIATLVFTAAYSRPLLAMSLLRRNDISYGVYIYHMPIVNFTLYLGGLGSLWASALTMVATVVAACLSWWGIERVALSRKRHPLSPRGVEPRSG